MAISDLQLSLLAIGAAGVVGVFAYNKWQERKHRSHAERVFGSDHADVLIETPVPSAASQRPVASEERERIEPRLNDALVDESPAPESWGAVSDQPVAAEPPLNDIDPRVDCLVRLDAAEAVAGNDFWTLQHSVFELIDKPLRWFALDTARREWRVLDAHTAGSFQHFQAALQMADRRGPLSGGELVSFYEGLQKLCDRFLAVVEYPQREQIAQAATELDAFCAGVDAQIGVHLVPTEEAFSGSKLKALIEPAGLALQGDGHYHAEDGEGYTLFTLSNVEPGGFAVEEMAQLQTRGLTFTLDVPRVVDGVAAFDRMIALAIRLAQNLGGRIVDDNGVSLTEPALIKIRDTVATLQRQMLEHELAAGSATALRLFD